MFDVNKISNKTEEKYFLADFDITLAKTLYQAIPELNKLIYKNMVGGRLSEKISDIHKLVNSISLQEAVEQIKVIEGENSKSGVYTTSTEINAFQIVKTILAIHSKIKMTTWIESITMIKRYFLLLLLMVCQEKKFVAL